MSKIQILLEQISELRKRHKMYGIALPHAIRQNWKFEIREHKFIGNKTWFVRAVAYPLGKLSFEICHADIYGNNTQYAPLDSPYVSNYGHDFDEGVVKFCGRVLSNVASEIESRYHKLFDQLSEESKELSQKVLEVLKAAEFEKDELRNEIDRLTKKEAQLTGERDGIENVLNEKRRRVSDEFQKRMDLGDKLRSLQRTIEEEARNLYNTRTFIAGSGTIKGIRERLMNAISEVELGPWSIYHDHKPPADLMPASGIVPPDIKRLKELGVRTPGEDSKKQ